MLMHNMYLDVIFNIWLYFVKLSTAAKEDFYCVQLSSCPSSTVFSDLLTSIQVGKENFSHGCQPERSSLHPLLIDFRRYFCNFRFWLVVVSYIAGLKLLSFIRLLQRSNWNKGFHVKYLFLLRTSGNSAFKWAKAARLLHSILTTSNSGYSSPSHLSQSSLAVLLSPIPFSPATLEEI